MKRKIIRIDEDKCNGCGLCIPNCPEGAIQLIDGKARLISDLFCDGLGACLGHCPEGAIAVEEREAEPYDERRVMENIVRQGPNTIKAHLHHLKEHNEIDYLKEAMAVLKEINIQIMEEDNKMNRPKTAPHGGGCPGSRSFSFTEPSEGVPASSTDMPSQLTHWPIQLHLISPAARQYQSADMLLAADCIAFSMGNFHEKFLKGKALAIACPKLDEGQEVYLAKLVSLIDDAKINTLTVAIMEVPCCSGLLQLAKQAVEQAVRKIPVKAIVVGHRGDILQEQWV